MNINIEKVNFRPLAECQEYILVLSKLWYEELSRHWNPNATVESAQENLLKHLNQNQMPMTFVALYEEKPIGMASLRENDGLQSNLTPWLGSLVVSPAYRNCKIGEALINIIKQQAKNLGYDKLYLLAFDAELTHWYKRLGWETIGMDNYLNHPVTIMSISI